MLLGATPDEIASALRRVLPAGAVVRVGAELRGARNVGVDLPRCPRGASPAVYRRQAHRALEGVGVLLAPDPLGPPADGQIRGSVRVADPPEQQLNLGPSAGGCIPARPSSPAPKVPDLPRAAIRDALGLVRVLWRASQGHPGRRYALEQTGEALGAVLKQPAGAHPDCGRLAVVALEALEAHRWEDGVVELVIAATDRVRGRPRTAREERERARAMRS